MAYTAGNLHLNPVAPGVNSYLYDAASDSMATVATVGYFNNSDDDLNLTAGDLIYCQCSDGNMWQRVSLINSGAVTTQYSGGNLPIQTWSTGTAAGDVGMSVGYYEVGTSVASGSRGVLPVPYPGAEVFVRKIDSGTAPFFFDAGASDSDISWQQGTGGGTGVTYDASNRRILLHKEGEYFHAVGKSATRWVLQETFYSASAISEGGSVSYPGT